MLFYIFMEHTLFYMPFLIYCNMLVLPEGGPLKVSEVVETERGDLPFRVLHAVGPRWWDYDTSQTDQIERCLVDLKNTVCKCFWKADELRIESIGVPSISSGNTLTTVYY